MKFYTTLFTVAALIAIISISSCKKDNESFDISEGQTNWTKHQLKDFEWSDEYCGFGVNDIQFYDQLNGLAVGFFCSHESSGVIYKTSDGGVTWDVGGYKSAGMGTTFSSVIAKSANESYFTFLEASSSSRILRSSDKGKTFDEIIPYYSSTWGASLKISSDNFFLDNFRIIGSNNAIMKMNDLSLNVTDYHSMFNPTIIASTHDGYGLVTENYGSNWDTVYYSAEEKFYCAAVSIYGHYFLGGTTFITSEDNGATWSEIGGIDGIITDILFIDSQIGFLCTSAEAPNQTLGVNHASGKIYKTTNGGKNWTLNYTSDFIGFNKLTSTGDSTVFAAGFQDNSNPEISSIYILKTTTLGE